MSSMESLGEYEIELLPEIEKLEAVSSSQNEGDDTVSSSWLSLSQLMLKKRVKGLLAFKGLPSTCKTQLAAHVASWGNCPALCIQHFLGDGKEFEDMNLSYDDLSPLNHTKAVEIHFQKAFANLMSVASFHLDARISPCVSIKSGFNTAYELHLLAKSCDTLSHYSRRGFTLVIIECTVRNKYLWKKRFEARLRWWRTWLSPRSWIYIEKVVDDDSAAQPPQCRQYLLQLAGASRFTIIYLRVDPFSNLSVDDNIWGYRIPDEFGDAIKYLLTFNKQVGLNPKHVYVVEYDELRRFLFDKKIREAASKGRTASICQGDCVFKYCPEAIEDPVEAGLCGICKEIISGSAYTCHFCVASLHKSCAEKIDVGALQNTGPYMVKFRFLFRFDKKRHCKACNEGGRDFSFKCRSCLFEDRLRFFVVPYIINHNHHNHFLSIQLINQDSTCKACGEKFDESGNYGCKRCAVYYHSRCAFMPLEFKDEHGGHTHVMNLKCSRHGMEEEEECWCDFCYKDMDPEHWFYSCPNCPHYALHIMCSRSYRSNFFDPKMVKFVDQIQFQFQDWVDQGNIPIIFPRIKIQTRATEI